MTQVVFEGTYPWPLESEHMEMTGFGIGQSGVTRSLLKNA